LLLETHINNIDPIAPSNTMMLCTFIWPMTYLNLWSNHASSKISQKFWLQIKLRETTNFNLINLPWVTVYAVCHSIYIISVFVIHSKFWVKIVHHRYSKCCQWPLWTVTQCRSVICLPKQQSRTLSSFSHTLAQ
jgi:hypothetical protein